MNITSEKTEETVAVMTTRIKRIKEDYFTRLQDLGLYDPKLLVYSAPSTPKDGLLMAKILEKVNMKAFITGGLSLAIGGYKASDVGMAESELYKRVLKYGDKEFTLGSLITALGVTKGDGNSTNRLSDETITLGRWCNLVAPIVKQYLDTHKDVSSAIYRKKYNAFYSAYTSDATKLADLAKPEEMRIYVFNGCERIIVYQEGKGSICQSWLKFLAWNDSKKTPPSTFAESALRYFMASTAQFETDKEIVRKLQVVEEQKKP